MADDKRVRVVMIPPADFRKDIENDPGLSKLIEDGYVIGTVVILDDPRAPENDRQRVTLLMVKPPAPQHSAVTIANNVSRIGQDDRLQTIALLGIAVLLVALNVAAWAIAFR